jgi:hypothetical protein
LEDGGFADAGGEGGKVRGERGGKVGRGGGDFIAKAVEVFLGGRDGAGGEELLEPGVESGVLGAGGRIAEESKEGGAVVGAEGQMKEDQAVGFALAEVESGPGATLEAESVR